MNTSLTSVQLVPRAPKLVWFLFRVPWSPQLCWLWQCTSLVLPHCVQRRSCRHRYLETSNGISLPRFVKCGHRVCSLRILPYFVVWIKITWNRQYFLSLSSMYEANRVIEYANIQLLSLLEIKDLCGSKLLVLKMKFLFPALSQLTVETWQTILTALGSSASLNLALQNVLNGEQRFH